MPIVEVDLFPRPRRVEWHGRTVPAGAVRRFTRVANLPAESYRIDIGTDSVDVSYADSNGRRYAEQTVAQLAVGDGFVACTIEDEPDIAVRGHMLDISRDRVPTRSTLELLVDRLAALRFNHLQLYTEHTFAYVDHETVWRDASPLSHADMQWLDVKCAAVGIELGANQNTFGHMERWLRHERYRSRAELPQGLARDGHVIPPTSLAATPENAEFALDLIRELSGALTSNLVNIGCDEVFELGRGRSRSAVEEHGRRAVFVEHLHRIAGPLLAEGRTVQFWADMLEADPEAGATLVDPEAIATLWSYTAPGRASSDGFDVAAVPAAARRIVEGFLASADRGFGPRLERFADVGFRRWVAPGTSGWNSFIGRHSNAIGNISDAVTSALEHGAEGVLITEWGDNGHHQPPFSTLPALAHGGAMMWNHAGNAALDDGTIAAAVDALVADDNHEFGRTLLELGSVADVLGAPQLNEAAFCQSWVDGFFLSPLPDPSASRVGDAIAQIDSALERLGRARPGARDGSELRDETHLAADMARHGLERILGQESAGAAHMTGDARGLVERYRSAWASRSRPGGLSDSISKLQIGDD